MKEKAPQDWAIPELESASCNRPDYEKKNNIVIRFSVYLLPGFHRNCIQCGYHYCLPWMAATIRDGREKVCPPCFVDSIREVRHAATQ